MEEIRLRPRPERCMVYTAMCLMVAYLIPSRTLIGVLIDIAGVLLACAMVARGFPQISHLRINGDGITRHELGRDLTHIAWADVIDDEVVESSEERDGSHRIQYRRPDGSIGHLEGGRYVGDIWQMQALVLQARDRFAERVHVEPQDPPKDLFTTFTPPAELEIPELDAWPAEDERIPPIERI